MKCTEKWCKCFFPLSLKLPWPLESVIRIEDEWTSLVTPDHTSYNTPLHAHTHSYILSVKPNRKAQKELVRGALMMCFSSPL